MRYFIYCRKSSEAEDRQVLSLDSQLSTLKERFAGDPNIEVVKIYEEAFSAKAPGRSVFDEMIKNIEAGEAQGILAWAPDRLARNSIDGGAIIYLLDRGRLQDLKFATYTFENNSQGKFMLQIMFGQSKYYSDALSENVKRGNRTKLERGEWPNQPPIGYLNNLASKTIDPDPERFTIVRKLFEHMLTGSYNPSQLWQLSRKEFGLRSVRHRRLGGNLLARSAIYKMLRNPFYAGLLVRDGRVYRGAHPAMITVSEFETIKSLLQRSPKTKPKVRSFSFTGLIRCGECGMMITAEEKTNRYGSQYTYYRCTKRRTDVTCSQPCIRLQDLEKQILEFVARLSLPVGLHAFAISELVKDAKVNAEARAARIRVAQQSIRDVERYLKNLTGLRTKDFITDEEYTSDRSRLLDEKANLAKQLLGLETDNATFEPAAVAISLSFKASKWFRVASVQEKRLLFSLLSSNPTLLEKKLFVEAAEPFKTIALARGILQMRAVVDDIRTKCLNRDPQLMKVFDMLKRYEDLQSGKIVTNDNEPWPVRKVG